MSYKRPKIPKRAIMINKKYDALVAKEIDRFNKKLEKLTALRVKTLMRNSERLKNKNG
jgi:hypothetical protein